MELVGEAFGFAPAVEERSDGVHQEDGKTYAFRVVAPVADDDGEKTAAATEDKLTGFCHWGGHHIGSHEAGAEHDATCENGCDRVNKSSLVAKPEDAAEDESGAYEADGDMPSDDATAEEEDGANEDGKGRYLTKRATDVADEIIPYLTSGLNTILLDETQRGGTSSGVGSGYANHREEVLARFRPCGHLHGEGDEHENTSDKGGVEGVLAKATEGHLADADGYKSSDDDEPHHFTSGGYVEGQKKAGDHCRAVADGGFCLEDEFLYQPLEQYAGGYRDDAYEQCVEAEESHSDNECWNQCQVHLPHNFLC